MARPKIYKITLSDEELKTLKRVIRKKETSYCPYIANKFVRFYSLAHS